MASTEMMDNYTVTTEQYSTTTEKWLWAYVVPPKWSLDIELALMVIVFVIGVPGNALIILVQAKSKNKNSTDYLVLIMALYEFIGSSVNVFFKVAYDIHALWLIFNSVLTCKLTQCIYAFAQAGAGQMLGMLAIDRCIKTVFPFNRVYGVGPALIVSIFVLVCSVALSVPHLVIQTWDAKSLQCALLKVQAPIAKYMGVASSVMLCVVFCIMSCCYLAIAVFLRRRHLRKVKRRKALSKPLQGILSSDVETTITSDATSVTVVEGQTASTVDGQTGVREKEANKSVVSKNAVLTLEGRNINRLTGLMFTISVVYVATNLILWFLFITRPWILGFGVLQLAYSIPMLNCISNPIMFVCMSSRFRENVRNLFK